MRWLRRVGLAIAVALAGPLLVVACGNVNLGGDWRTADRSATGLAPDPAIVREAIVQVYAARAFNWRGIFGVHTWIAIKPDGAAGYTVHQVMGWRKYGDLPVVVSRPDAPDRAWYGNPPSILADLRGAAASAAIPRIEAAIREYPYRHEYVLWPGPNSNTFTAYVARRVPELGVDLPTTAIGKDFLENGRVLARAPSGTGFQLSLFGLVGAIAAIEEGIEVNLLGLVFGVDPLGPAIKLPGIGRVGFDLDRRLLRPVPAAEPGGV